MNFRAEFDHDGTAHVLGFGEGSHIAFDQYGAVTELHAHPLDRGFRFSAQRIARAAASQARLELAKPTYGRRDSVARRKFIDRVATIANSMEI